MLPKLTVTLTTVIAACAAVLAMSAGLFATRDPGENISGVPSVSRPLVRHAIVEDSDSQHSRVTAYARRADELQRLRDLPTASPAPALAVIASAAAAAPAETPAAAPAEAPPAAAALTAPATPSATPDRPTVVANAPTAIPAEAPAAVPAEAPAAAITAPAPQAAPAVVASAPAAIPAEPSAPPAATLPEAPTGSIPQVAPVQAPGTAAVKTEEKRAEPKARRGKTHARPDPTHKKARKETHKVARVAPRTSIPPAAKTGFPIDLPSIPQGSTNSSTPVLRSQQDMH